MITNKQSVIVLNTEKYAYLFSLSCYTVHSLILEMPGFFGYLSSKRY